MNTLLIKPASTKRAFPDPSWLRLSFFAALLFGLCHTAAAQGLGPIPEFNADLRPDIDVYRSQGADFVFENSDLKDIQLVLPTAIDFGPDGRLYVGQKNGLIQAYTYVRNGSQDYQIMDTEKIFTLKVNTANHDDDGEPNSGIEEQEGGWTIDMAIERQLTGILVVGTAENPVIFATSSDPRAGGGGVFNDSGLDTNSGVVHKIYKENGTWKKIDLVRGLPRNEENHSTNGLQLDEANNILYVAVGGMTNAGSPSNNFALVSEYALAAAILSVDLDMIDAMPVLGSGEKLYVYDLPTLDDPTRPNANGINDPATPGYNGIDVNDPFGGNNGLNQAKVIPGGPVQLYATGFRNPYDIVLTDTPGRQGRLYSIDNGANVGWGGFPMGEDEYPNGSNPGSCTNEYDPAEPGSSTAMGNDDKVNNLNGLHFIREVEAGKRYYAGHPAPVRGNPSGAGLFTRIDGVDAWRTSTSGDNPLPADWPPVPESEAYAAECDFRNSGVDDGALANYFPSTNGIAEFRASTFDGALVGSLISVGMNGEVYIAQLNASGDTVINGDANGVEILFPSIGGVPLDLAIQGDQDPYPGTIWIVGYQGEKVTIFEPLQSNVAVEEDETIPLSFTLKGNYPNPFNESTSIVVDLPYPASVTVDVYDMLGRKVYQSEEENLPAGTSRGLDIPGSTLASGRYLYRVTARMPHETSVKSGRMTLVR